MTSKIPQSPDTLQLRNAAEQRLKEQTAPLSVGWLVGIDTLKLLYGLASTPERAADALKLLHELQVHQVELDLLHLELEASQRAMVEDLARYKGAYDFAPFSSFIVTLDGRMLEANLAGGRMLGVDRDELSGIAMEIVLAATSRTGFQAFLAGFRDGCEEASCHVAILADDTELPTPSVRVAGRLLPDRVSVLLVVAD